MPDFTPSCFLCHILSCIMSHTWTNLLEGFRLLLLHFICCYDSLVIGVCKRTEPARGMTTASGFPSTAARALNAPASVMTFPSVTRFQDRNYKPNHPSVCLVPPLPQLPQDHPHFQPSNMSCRYVMVKKYRERLNKHIAKPDYFPVHLLSNDVTLSESGHGNAVCKQVSSQTQSSDLLPSNSTASNKSEPNPFEKII